MIGLGAPARNAATAAPEAPVPFAGDLLLEHTGAGFTLHNRRGVPVLSVPVGRSQIAGVSVSMRPAWAIAARRVRASV